jgi:hypothetical protein
MELDTYCQTTGEKIERVFGISVNEAKNFYPILYYLKDLRFMEKMNINEALEYIETIYEGPIALKFIGDVYPPLLSKVIACCETTRAEVSINELLHVIELGLKINDNSLLVDSLRGIKRFLPNAFSLDAFYEKMIDKAVATDDDDLLNEIRDVYDRSTASPRNNEPVRDLLFNAFVKIDSTRGDVYSLIRRLSTPYRSEHQKNNLFLFEKIKEVIHRWTTKELTAVVEGKIEDEDGCLLCVFCLMELIERLPKD